MALEKPRVKLPETAKVGELIEIRTLITHPMETGQRRDPKTGQVIPRQIINSFQATFNGKPVFRMSLLPGVAANPFISFHMRVTGPGEFKFTWIEDGGASITEQVRLEVH